MGFMLVPGLSFAQVSDNDPNPNTDQCETITNNMRYRDRDVNKNGDVSTLQDFLQSQGYLKSEQSGYFGLLTVKAVKDFQKNNNINPSGYFGPITIQKIKDITCGGVMPSPNPVPTPTPVPTSSITVLSPNGGETWVKGETKTISWKDNTTSASMLPTYYDVKLISYNYNPPVCTADGICSGTVAMIAPLMITKVNGLSYSWQVGNVANSSNVPEGAYKIQVCRSGTGACDLSDSYFKIVSSVLSTCTSSSEPSITVLSPNGGETYTAGQQITVKWKSCNIPANDKLDITLKNVDQPMEQDLTNPTGTFNDGSETFTLNLPSPMQLGTHFKVLVNDSYLTTSSGQGVFDWSDNLFTINSPTISSGDVVPRIMYWYGKVNQHVDVNGNWLTDPDGTSGANIDKLTYCKKWYPNTTSVEDSRLETINSWRNAGNLDSFTSIKMSTKCVQGAAFPSFAVLSPNGGETLIKGNKQIINWKDDVIGVPISPIYYDINLVHYYPPCTTDHCLMSPILAPFTIAKNVTGLSYDWQVGNIISTGISNVMPPDGQYSIQICKSGTTICDLSDNAFTLSSITTSTPSITVLSPNGGETYTAGQQIPIRWNSLNFSPSGSAGGLDIRIAISAILPSGETSTWMIPQSNGGFSANDGEELITLPTTLENGAPLPYGQNFKISVMRNDPSAQLPYLGDLSDNFFTINRNTITPCSSSNCNITKDDLLTTKNVSYKDQEINPNQTNYKIGSFIVVNYSNEPVRLTNLNINILQKNLSVPISDLSNLVAKNNNTVLSSPVVPTYVNNIAIDLTVSAGFYKQIDVYADIGSVASGTIQTALSANGVGANTNVKYPKYPTTSTSLPEGQIITIENPNTIAESGESQLTANVLGSFSNAVSNRQNPKPKLNVDSANSKTSVCSEITINLKRGMYDSQVKCLQKMLNEKGFKVEGIENGKETTYFGPATLVALKAFQASNKINATGILGPNTRAVLKNIEQ